MKDKLKKESCDNCKYFLNKHYCRMLHEDKNKNFYCYNYEQKPLILAQKEQ